MISLFVGVKSRVLLSFSFSLILCQSVYSQLIKEDIDTINFFTIRGIHENSLKQNNFDSLIGSEALKSYSKNWFQIFKRIDENGSMNGYVSNVRMQNIGNKKSRFIEPLPSWQFLGPKGIPPHNW